MPALRFAAAAFAASLLAAAVALGSCGPIQQETIWICDNPETGKAPDTAIYDSNHYVNGVFDPCHCFDPCGPLPQCPIEVEAGPPGCDAGGMPPDGG